MIRHYDADPSPGFIAVISDKAAGNIDNIRWLQEAIDAKGRIREAAAYMESSVKDHGYFSNDTLCYILFGIDFDAFEAQVRPKTD